MSEAKKITLQVDPELLQKALKSTNKGISETVRMGLQLLAAQDAYQKAIKLRGKYKIQVDVEKLREDR